MFLFFVCLALVSLAVYPHAAVAFRRRRQIRRLARLAHALGGRLRLLRRTVILSRNRGKQYDLILEQGSNVYAIKLWSARRRDTVLRISENGLVSEERTVRAPLAPRGTRRERILRSPFFKVPMTRLRHPLPKDRQLVRILLVMPPYRRVLRYRQGEWQELHSGDTVFDKLLYSSNALEQLLQKNAPPPEVIAQMRAAEEKAKTPHHRPPRPLS